MPDNDHRVLLTEFLQQQEEADRKLATDPHAAVKDAQQVVLDFIIKAARAIAPEGGPRAVPGEAIRRFLIALDERDRGILDTVLRPAPAAAQARHTVPLAAKLARADVGISMDMLMRAELSFDAAGKEVVRVLGENHRVFHGLSGKRQRIVERFRSETINSDDPDIKQLFNECLEEVTRTLRDRDGGAAELIRIAHMRLRDIRYA
jgi:hypothetical protein